MRLIDAEDVKKRADCYPPQIRNVVANILRHTKTVKPEQKKGKWIEEIGMLMCSECGDAWGTEQFDEVMSFNFCPNCGAKMEAER